jgi:uncharacterized protein
VKLRSAGLLLLCLSAVSARAQEVIPPAPQNHFNDYAAVVRPETAASLDAELTQYERDSSNQVLVAIYPKMQSDSSVEDYTVRVAQAWHTGLKGKDNGAILFVFVASHQVRIQVGYGLEGVLTDALSKEIVSNAIVPAFRQNDFDGGVTAGVHAILAVAKNEYKGTGATVNDGHRRQSSAFLIFFGVLVLVMILRARGAMYQSGGRRTFGGVMPIIFPGGGGGFGGGGGGFGGGGGSYSGGGGSFGGGGAGGSW